MYLAYISMTRNEKKLICGLITWSVYFALSEILKKVNPKMTEQKGKIIAGIISIIICIIIVPIINEL